MLASEPGYPIGGALENSTHYGFGIEDRSDDEALFCGAPFPVVDKTGEVEWLGSVEGAMRLGDMRPLPR